MSERSLALERMLAARPEDGRLRFGLAIEYLKESRVEEGIAALRSYLASADDEGNAWARLGQALASLGRLNEAREAYREGARAASRHGHPTLAEEIQVALSELEG